MSEPTIKCPFCSNGYQSAGKGIVGTWPCSHCNGTGKQPQLSDEVIKKLSELELDPPTEERLTDE